MRRELEGLILSPVTRSFVDLILNGTQRDKRRGQRKGIPVSLLRRRPPIESFRSHRKFSVLSVVLPFSDKKLKKYIRKNNYDTVLQYVRYCTVVQYQACGKCAKSTEMTVSL
jgi:hypothetical protein